MKKLIIWVVILVTLPLIFISHLVVFGVTDTTIQEWHTRAGFPIARAGSAFD